MRFSERSQDTRKMVPEEGVEPTRPCGHRILSPARLPVPPFGQQLKIARPRLALKISTALGWT
jgi:hypothetical protein